ncbi:MAG: flavodoxin family protein [Clostridia bacterium]|nr:flavodoxin family protein [Clostridia bacterium]
MKALILSFSSNQVNEDSFIPNKKGLTFACVEECQKALNQYNIANEHICINKKNIKKCNACGERGWGICLDKQHICIQKDDFNDIYKYMENFDAYIFITPVYFHEMSESAKTFFDRLKRCDSFNKNSKIKGKKIVCIACAGGSGTGTDETLNSFDILNYFLGTKMHSRIPITKNNFDNQRSIIIESMRLENK